MALKSQISSISAVIIAKNEEEKIGDCLKSLFWSKEVLVIDNGSTDKTSDIAKKLGAKVIYSPLGAYKESRDRGMKEVKGDWVLYVDADERVTPGLKEEILSVTHKPHPTTHNYTAYAIPRKNIILGKQLNHGGWWPDYVIHFIKRNEFRGWKGELHEEPVFVGDLGYLTNPLIHTKYNNLSDMVAKTNTWSHVEAKLMFDANHPPMNIPRFASATAREFWLRMIRNLAFLDGPQGIIYALYQVYSKFITYSKLWEMQLNK
jgi:glycosyltransferase involved in cell wall biosynthesis